MIVLKDVNENATSATPEGYEYSFITKSWSFIYRRTPDSGSAISSNGHKTNFVFDRNGDLIWHTNYLTQYDKVIKWVDEGQNYNDDPTVDYASFYFRTKDFDFGNPAVRKKIYKVYVTFMSVDASGAAAGSGVAVKYAINGKSSDAVFTGTFNSSTSKNYTGGFLSDGGSSTDWITAELKPSSTINNVYSFAMQFLAVAGPVPAGFKINDISIVYRIKRAK